MTPTARLVPGISSHTFSSLGMGTLGEARGRLSGFGNNANYDSAHFGPQQVKSKHPSRSRTDMVRRPRVIRQLGHFDWTDAA